MFKLRLNNLTGSGLTYTTRKFLSFEIGRVSTIVTTSPTLYVLFSSCALYFLFTAYRFLYFGCCTKRETETTTVLSILSDTTVPLNVFLLLIFVVFIVLIPISSSLEKRGLFYLFLLLCRAHNSVLILAIVFLKSLAVLVCLAFPPLIWNRNNRSASTESFSFVTRSSFLVFVYNSFFAMVLIRII